MLEAASHATPPVQLKMPIPFKSNAAENNSEETPESIVKQARQLKLDALKLYHQALDNKYQIYKAKYRELKDNITDSKQYEQTMSYAGDAITFYKAGDELLNQSMVGIDLETYEKSGTLKRNAVISQEKGLLNYLDDINGNAVASATTPPIEKTVPFYIEIHKGDDAKTPVEKATEMPEKKETPQSTPQQIVSKALSGTNHKESVLNYKIQIGVFRNNPDPAMLEKLQDVSSEVLPGSGLKKYYTGNFNNYDDAVNMISQVRQIGFDGAFVVAFYHGKQITVSEARELQNKD